jgi:hypothetical protein
MVTTILMAGEATMKSMESAMSNKEESSKEGGSSDLVRAIASSSSELPGVRVEGNGGLLGVERGQDKARVR